MRKSKLEEFGALKIFLSEYLIFFIRQCLDLVCNYLELERFRHPSKVVLAFFTVPSLLVRKKIKRSNFFKIPKDSVRIFLGLSKTLKNVPNGQKLAKLSQKNRWVAN